MSDDRQQAGQKDGSSDAQGDSENALQDELRREAAEGKGAVGDAASNRNLSGSSTWETLPESDENGGESRQGNQ